MSVAARAAAFAGTASTVTSKSVTSEGGSGDYVLLKLDDSTKRPLAISCHAWSKDGTLLAFSPANHEVHIVKYENGAIIPMDVLRAHDHRVTAIDWAPGSNRILTCGQDRNAYVWTQEDGVWNPTLVILQFNRSATFAKWSHSEKKFAVASGSGTIAVCYYEEENNWWTSKTIEGFNSTVLTLAWHPSDTVLAAGSSDSTVRLFSAAFKGVDKKPVPLFGPDINLGKLGVSIFELNVGAWVMDVAFSPSGEELAYVTHDSRIHFFKVLNGDGGVPPIKDNIQSLRMSGLPHCCLLFLSNGKVVAAGHDNNPVLYARDDTTWTEKSKLDDSKSKRSAGTDSARNAAFKKFEMATSQGIEDESKAGDSLPTRHQIQINSIRLRRFVAHQAAMKRVAVDSFQLRRPMLNLEIERMQPHSRL